MKRYIEFVPIKVYQNTTLNWGTSMLCYLLSLIDDIIILLSFGFIRSAFSWYYMSYTIKKNFKKHNPALPLNKGD